ncbi:MAG: type II secretion system minor pseudopilin GspK [Tepidimonas ignava]|uniref:type II secretion system minor pseudopilin GspK n=1 Tax=Tepidimonas ignava TaxID=114249 RepID=UPI00391B1490
MIHIPRGSALLVALMLMAVVAALGAAAWSLQWRAWAVERAERQQAQAAWLLTGALDWARLIVREDGRASTNDHLGEPWAVPLQPTRLGTFLRTHPTVTEDDPAQAAWLSGRIEDVQARLNWRNLIDTGVHPPRLAPLPLAAFERLYAVLGLPSAELHSVAQQLLAAWPSATQPARNLPPQRLEDLRSLGLSTTSLTALQPWTTWLPEPTPVNVNTAPAPVLRAVIAGLEPEEAKRLVTVRNQRPFDSLGALSAQLPQLASVLQPTQLTVSSRYFVVTGQLRLDDLEVEQQALLRRDGTRVTVLWRTRRTIPSVSALPD